MISSMTAFARKESASAKGSVSLEIRSVNHRYLDLTIKLPDALRELEPAWREHARKRLARGKVEITLRHDSGTSIQQKLCVDDELCSAVIDAASKISDKIGSPLALNPLDIMRWPGVISDSTVIDSAIQERADELLGQCLDSLLDNRGREGEKLATIMREKMLAIANIVGQCRTLLPELLENQQNRLLSRLEELRGNLDNDRVEQELVHMAQRADVEEELDRLDAHLLEVGLALDTGGPCGRRLDFLMQELNREANTLASKSMALSTTVNAVELKVLIEQMREQIQNIE
ncbi:MAG: hypothetical protein ACI9GW_002178 [Halieaceae bacterium]|jgi:uncharacterized protein (TIGR00255 family)